MSNGPSLVESKILSMSGLLFGNVELLLRMDQLGKVNPKVSPVNSRLQVLTEAQELAQIMP